jgi:hypothetical protein
MQHLGNWSLPANVQRSGPADSIVDSWQSASGLIATAAKCDEKCEETKQGPCEEECELVEGGIRVQHVTATLKSTI